MRIVTICNNGIEWLKQSFRQSRGQTLTDKDYMITEFKGMAKKTTKKVTKKAVKKKGVELTKKERMAQKQGQAK